MSLWWQRFDPWPSPVSKGSGIAGTVAQGAAEAWIDPWPRNFHVLQLQPKKRKEGKKRKKEGRKGGKKKRNKKKPRLFELGSASFRSGVFNCL